LATDPKLIPTLASGWRKVLAFAFTAGQGDEGNEPAKMQPVMVEGVRLESLPWALRRPKFSPIRITGG
jgi:hypothetical protein